MMTDPIADMLTRLRNGVQAKHVDVEMPASKIKEAIAHILQKEGFIEKVERLQTNKQGTLKIKLKYDLKHKGVIAGIRRVSTPGLRIYVNNKQIPRVLNGLGLASVSTSKGLLSDKECRKLKTGGEVLCYIW